MRNTIVFALTVFNCSVSASLVLPDTNTSLGKSTFGSGTRCTVLPLAFRITCTLVPPTPNELMEIMSPGSGVGLSTTCGEIYTSDTQ